MTTHVTGPEGYRVLGSQVLTNATTRDRGKSSTKQSLFPLTLLTLLALGDVPPFSSQPLRFFALGLTPTLAALAVSILAAWLSHSQALHGGHKP